MCEGFVKKKRNKKGTNLVNKILISEWIIEQFSPILGKYTYTCAKDLSKKKGTKKEQIWLIKY